MNVNAIRYDMFFNYGVNGFSESHWIAGNNPSNPAIVAAAIALTNARLKIFDGYHGEFWGGRLSYGATFRDAYEIGPNAVTLGGNGTPYPGQIIGNSQSFVSVHDAWPIDFEIEDGLDHADTYISGIGMPGTLTGPLPTQALYAGVQFSTALTIYANALIAGNWGGLYRNWGTVLGNPPVPITGGPTWLAGLGGQSPTITISFTTPGGFDSGIGDTFRIQGAVWRYPVRRLRPNGTYKIASVSSVAGTTSIVFYVPKYRQAPNFLAAGTVQFSTQTVALYTDFALRPITHKKRGAPFGAGRGRKAWY